MSHKWYENGWEHSSNSTVVLVEALSYSAQHSHVCFSVWVAASEEVGCVVCVVAEHWDGGARYVDAGSAAAGGRGGELWWSLRLSWLRLASTMLSRRCRSSVCRVTSDCSDRKASFNIMVDHIREVHVVRGAGSEEGMIPKKADDANNLWSMVWLWLAVVWFLRRTMLRCNRPVTARRPYVAANSSIRLYFTLYY